MKFSFYCNEVGRRNDSLWHWKCTAQCYVSNHKLHIFMDWQKKCILRLQHWPGISLAKIQRFSKQIVSAFSELGCCWWPWYSCLIRQGTKKSPSSLPLSFWFNAFARFFFWHSSGPFCFPLCALLKVQGANTSALTLLCREKKYSKRWCTVAPGDLYQVRLLLIVCKIGPKQITTPVLGVPSARNATKRESVVVTGVHDNCKHNFAPDERWPFPCLWQAVILLPAYLKHHETTMSG